MAAQKIAGRPSDLTEEFKDAFLNRIRLRLSVDRASWGSGKNPRTVRQWLQRGREEVEEGAHSVSEPPKPVEFGKGVSRYALFYIDYQKATGMLEETWAKVLYQVLQVDEDGHRVADPELGNLALRVLAVANPKKWSKKTYSYQKLDARFYLEKLGAYEQGDLDTAAIRARLARDDRGRNKISRLIGADGDESSRSD